MTTSDAPRTMLPAAAYTSPEVLAWERRHLFAGTWTCLGRLADLLGRPAPPSARSLVGDVLRLLVRRDDEVRMFANTCRHRGHELLPEGESSRPPGGRLPLPRLELRPGRGR